MYSEPNNEELEKIFNKGFKQAVSGLPKDNPYRDYFKHEAYEIGYETGRYEFNNSGQVF